MMRLALLTMGALTAWSAATAHAEPALRVELNKLEDHDGGCRAYMVFANGSATAFAAFKLDLVLFGTDGVIARRLAVEAAPLRAEKTSVKLFDIAGLPCSGIGAILVNDVLDCRDANGPRADCASGLAVTSRADVKLTR